MSNPRELFPVEVWEMILSYVDDPKDKYSCSLTCTLFENYFSSTRTFWTFPLIFPSVMKFLPKSDVLQCRLVTKDLRNAIDNFLLSDKSAPILVQQLRSHRENFNTSFLTRIPNDQRQIMVVAHHHNQIIENQRREYLDRLNQGGNRNRGDHGGHFWAPENPNHHHNEFLRFLLSFGSNPNKNPFPSRAVVVFITDAPIQNMDLFFTKFGGHIWSLKLVLRAIALRDFFKLELIWKILRRVPNLKHLLIEELSQPSNSPSEEDDNFFNKMLDKTTIPVLNQLQWVELDIKLQKSIQDFFVKAYLSKSVTIFERDGYIKPTYLTPADGNHLDLQIKRKSSSEDWKEHIRSFKLLNLPLESIHLHYFKCEDFGAIFGNLSKYGSTLHQLKLSFTTLQIEELVKMKNQVDAIYVSFLSQMRCLENFNMTFDCADCGRAIEFRKFVDQFFDADWIEKYLEMGGVISGFRRFGVAGISAGLKMKANESSNLKLQYFTLGKYFRSMDVIPSENN